ncbi:NADP-dependent oxidoreductase [Candidatus Falkowbacteria bacterium]|nr:NADP-dependent oxidoreductase [Candidatus Falkowbacteria bacterium]
MRSLQINKYGGNEVVELNLEARKPSLTSETVLVEVLAAGVNPIDWKIRQGYLAQMLPLEFPVTLGGDFSGRISAVGEKVAGLKVGDEVYGQAGVLLGGNGSFAESILVSPANLAKKPNSVDMIEAAALPLAGVSAVQSLYEQLALKKEQSILIHGGAGGIGSYAVQIAKNIGAKVYATAKTADLEYVKSLGADEAIDYRTQKFEEVIKDLDAVFDTVGGNSYAKSFQVIKRGGVINSMVEQPNEDLAKQYGVRALNQFTQVNTGRLDTLAKLVDQGVVKVHIEKTFGLEQGSEALAYLEEKHPNGKIVIKIK